MRLDFLTSGITGLQKPIFNFVFRRYHTSPLPMNKAIQRFITRLSLPENMSFKLIDCKENKNAFLLKKFEAKKNEEKEYKILQLYHAVFSSELGGDEAVKSIYNTGFRITGRGNKGSGVYLANHSRYSWIWASSYHPVVICDVIFPLEQNNKKIKRYRSEIYSPIWNSEYIVNDASLIYPKYALNYQISGKIPHSIQDQFGFVNHGEFGCAHCDSQIRGTTKGIRCDCELTPTIDPGDIFDSASEKH